MRNRIAHDGHVALELPKGHVSAAVSKLRQSVRQRSAYARVRRYGARPPEEEATVGRYTYGAPSIRRYKGDTGSVQIGAFCSIADDVVMTVGGDHVLSWPSTYPFRARLDLPGAYTDGHPRSKGDIQIGSDVWIGRGARILSGVRIGDGAVVGAYAVVRGDVRPYAIVLGNPAREVRRRFTEDQVAALLRIRWWDWPEARIRANIVHLNAPDVESFIKRFRVEGNYQAALGARFGNSD